MNKQDVEDLLVKAVADQPRASHQAILDNPETLARYREFSWWNEEFTPNTDDDDEDSYLDWAQLHWDWTPTVIDGTKVEVVKTDGGTEGGGEYTCVVVKLTHADGAVEYWKKEGFYASHYGTDWDGDFSQVNAVERLVTFYE